MFVWVPVPEGMTVLKVPRWQKYAIYFAVRSFGWMAWKRNQWDREYLAIM